MFACTVPAYARSADTGVAFVRWLGTWSLNIAKSDFGAAVLQRGGRIIFAAANIRHWRLIIDGYEPDGKQSHAEVTFMPDGKNYSIEGWYPNTTISITNLGRKLMWTIRLRGNPVDKTLIEMTPDRRSFTVTSQYVEQVEPINCLRIYERQ